MIHISLYAFMAQKRTLLKPTKAHTRIKLSYIINIVTFLHVSATHLKIFRELLYERLIHQNITVFFKPMNT